MLTSNPTSFHFVAIERQDRHGNEYATAVKQLTVDISSKSQFQTFPSLVITAVI